MHSAGTCPMAMTSQKDGVSRYEYQWAERASRMCSPRVAASVSSSSLPLLVLPVPKPPCPPLPSTTWRASWGRAVLLPSLPSAAMTGLEKPFCSMEVDMASWSCLSFLRADGPWCAVASGAMVSYPGFERRRFDSKGSRCADPAELIQRQSLHTTPVPCVSRPFPSITPCGPSLQLT